MFYKLFFILLFIVLNRKSYQIQVKENLCCLQQQFWGRQMFSSPYCRFVVREMLQSIDLSTWKCATVSKNRVTRFRVFCMLCWKVIVASSALNVCKCSETKLRKPWLRKKRLWENQGMFWSCNSLAPGWDWRKWKLCLNSKRKQKASVKQGSMSRIYILL